MAGTKVTGIILLVLGLILLFMGYQSSLGMDDQIMETFTGRFTEQTTWLFIFGGVSTVAGIALLVYKP
jgi:hypothetical protein